MSPNPVDVEQHMLAAKAQFSRAARAVLAGMPLAEVMTAAALADLEQARAALRGESNGRATAVGTGVATPVAQMGAQHVHADDQHLHADLSGPINHNINHCKSFSS